MMRLFCGVGPRSDHQPAAAVGLQHGLLGVGDDVEENLLQLVRVGDGLGQVAVEFAHDLDVVHREFVIAQLDGALQDVVHARQRAFRFLLAREREQVLHDLLAAQRQVVDLEQAVAGALVQILAQLQELGIAHDAGERIVQLVGNAGDQFADGGEFFGLDQLLLQQLFVADVLGDVDGSDQPVVLVVPGADRNLERAAHGRQFDLLHHQVSRIAAAVVWRQGLKPNSRRIDRSRSSTCRSSRAAWSSGVAPAPRLARMILPVVSWTETQSCMASKVVSHSFWLRDTTWNSRAFSRAMAAW